MESRLAGLSSRTAARRLAEEGPNTLPDACRRMARSRNRMIVDTLRLPNPALWWITSGALAALAGVAGVAWYEAYKYLRPRK